MLPLTSMNLVSFTPTTTGEHLFQVIVRDHLGLSALSQLQASPMLRVGGRTDDLSEYFIGVSALNLLSRVVKKAERIRTDEQETLHQVSMVSYIQKSLGISVSPGSDSVDRFASLALKTAADSKRPIKDAVKIAVLNGQKELACYVCGGLLLKKPDALPENRIEYEHIWPASFGGNSIPENLLPACGFCNRAKGHMMLWQSAHVAAFVLKPSPSEEELKSIQRSEKVAKHTQSIFSYACHHRTSLKDAALAVGSISMSSVYSVDADDAMDFFNFEFR